MQCIKWQMEIGSTTPQCHTVRPPRALRMLDETVKELTLVASTPLPTMRYVRLTACIPRQGTKSTDGLLFAAAVASHTHVYPWRCEPGPTALQSPAEECLKPSTSKEHSYVATEPRWTKQRFVVPLELVGQPLAIRRARWL
eukprot:scaffold159599_cov43-Tisochrysis_lutea.AAC.2